MFEHVQQRNRSRLLVPVLALAGICVIAYVVVDRWSRRSRESDAIALFDHTAAAKILSEGRLERVALPGMSVSFPGTPVVTGDYVAGSAQYNDIGVGWTPGNLIMDLAFEQQQFKSFHGGYELPTKTQLAGNVALEEHVGDTIHIVAGTCGHRIVIFEVHASRNQFDKIKASFECKPERELEHLGVVVKPSNGWKRTNDDPNLHLEHGDDVMNVRQRRGEQSNSTYGIADGTAPVVKGDYKIWRGKGNGLDGKPRLTAVVEWPCPGRSYRGFALIVSPTSVDSGIDVALTGRCISETAPIPPELAPPAS